MKISLFFQAAVFLMECHIAVSILVLIRMLIYIKFNQNTGTVFSATIIFVYIYFGNFIGVESLECGITNYIW